MVPRLTPRARRAGQPVKNFHLPLPVDVYEDLRDQASRLQKPATVVAREAIEMWLQHRRRTVLREAIAAYAVEHAASQVDLDPALDQASVELLRPKPAR